MADKQKPGVMIYFDLRPCLQRLTNEQKGALFSAILNYAENGVLPELDDIAVGVAWDFVKPRIDRDTEVYAGKIVKARAAAGKRWSVQTYADACAGMPTHTDALFGNAEQCEAMPEMPTSKTNSTTTPTTSNGDMALTAPTPTTDKPKAKRFVPPTLGEVREYVRSRNSPVDPQGFIDFYEAKGWLVGKSPMKDWKAACRNAEGWDRWRQKPGAYSYAQEQPARKSFSELIAERTGTK